MLALVSSALETVVILVGAAVVGFLVGYLIEAVLLVFLGRVAARTKNAWDDGLVKALRPGLALLAAVVAFAVAIHFAAPGLPSSALHWTNVGLAAVTVLIAALILSRFVKGGVRAHVRRHPQRRALGSVVQRSVSVALYIVAFLVILGTLGIEITPLLASLGIGGLALALALQDSLSNFFAGLWMRSARDIRPGDFVRLEERGLEGYVDDVGWRTTRIRTLPNNFIIVPNAYLAQTVVTNYHLPEPRMSLLIPIQTGYEVDPDFVTAILVEEALAAVDSAPGLLRDPEPFVRLIPGFGEFGMQFTLICQVAEFTDQYLAQDVIRRRVLARFRREGIRIPYPIRETIQVTGERGSLFAMP